MKHSLKITALLISMFLVAQLIGIYVANAYLPETKQVLNEETGELESKKIYDLPYGLDPPEDIEPQTSAISIIIAIFIAVGLMFLLMRLKAESFIRIWFFIVVSLGIALALNAIVPLPNPAIISLLLAVPLAALKVFQRNIIVHNLTELLIYPGIASVFIPLLSVPTVVFLLIVISIYDMYAVWHAGFMQTMAKYQIEKVKIFSGFFIPYIGRKERQKLNKLTKPKKVQVHLAILGGGDVVFPILLSGVVLATLGILPAIMIALGATVALTFLFIMSEKGKFYPAMPFISTGCIIALIIAYFI